MLLCVTCSASRRYSVMNSSLEAMEMTVPIAGSRKGTVDDVGSCGHSRHSARHTRLLGVTGARAVSAAISRSPS